MIFAELPILPVQPRAQIQGARYGIVLGSAALALGGAKWALGISTFLVHSSQLVGHPVIQACPSLITHDMPSRSNTIPDCKLNAS